MNYTALLGRICFALLFISAGVYKFQTFDPETGGELADYVGSRLEHTFAQIKDVSSVDIPLEKAHYPALLGAAIAMETLGGILFVLGSPLGAWLMMIFLICVTPVIHNFWDATGEEQSLQMANFMKNVSMVGALLLYVALRGELSGCQKQLATLNKQKKS